MKKIPEATIEKGPNGLYLKNFYTPLSVAKKEIWRRWNDKELKRKVEKFLGKGIPKIFGKEPKAVLSRYIITPNYEFFYFNDSAKLIGLKKACLEYTSDKLVARNELKYHLCRLYIYDGEGKNRGDKLRSLRIVNFNTNEGRKTSDVRTVWREKLINFHHRLIKKTSPEVQKDIVDFSKWFNNKRFKFKGYYYLPYLSLFICHGVLFENILMNKTEKEFTEKNIIPSFKKAEKIFGVKPLVVPLTPFDEENSTCWYHYPSKVVTDYFKNKK